MRFNWKQERGQVWVWGGDRNEKMIGPSRPEGDSGGGSHGREDAPHAGRPPGRDRHVGGSAGMLTKTAWERA